MLKLVIRMGNSKKPTKLNRSSSTSDLPGPGSYDPNKYYKKDGKSVRYFKTSS